MRVIAKKNSSFTLQCTRGSSTRLDVSPSADSDKIKLGQIVEGDVIPAGTYVVNANGNPPSQKFFRNNTTKDKTKLIKSFNRQALHATKLCFKHPINKKYMEFSSSLPKDIIVLIDNLKL